MSSKVQTNHDDKVASKQRSSKPTVRDTAAITEHIHLATMIQRARFEPGLLTPHDVLQLQRTIGNQAAQRLLQAKPDDLEARSSTKEITRFAHDFSQIPVHAKSPASVQAKLTVSSPGDIYEQEADQVSNQVMHMTEQQLQRTCACGGGCSKCQTEQPNQEHERLQTKRIQANDTGETIAPPTVYEVLRSPGQPLDPAARLFMEPRFGHDFSKLRVHTDAKAAESAQAIGAAAYTVGNDIVFGAGEFNPQNSAGRQLIAHELTHVVQQSKGGRNVQHISRQPKKGKVVRVERESRFRRRPPGPGAYTDAEYSRWLERYPDLKREFVDLVNGKRTQDKAYTPEELWRRGYFYAVKRVHGDWGYEVWLNDDGDGKKLDIAFMVD
jgi:Domain of unknown function (DUF4157)